ncbi:MAG: ABC transporter ATP-binding protein [Thermosynechococcaceae cyanobacterium]
MTDASLVPDRLTQRRSPRASDWRLFLRIVPYARPYGRTLGISALLLIPLSLASAVQPIFIGQAIGLLRDEPTTFSILRSVGLSTGLAILSGLLLITVLLRFGLQAVQGFLVTKVGQQITIDIRNDLFRHVLSLAAQFFDRTPVGRLITRLTSDVEALGDVFATGAVGIFSDLFSIATIVVIMFAIQWDLALLLVFLLIPTSILIWYFQYEYRKANYKARDELSALNSTLQENLSGIGVVQLFRREQFNSQMFRETNQRYVQEVDRTIFFDAAVSATLEWIGFMAIAGVLWLGGTRILHQTLTFSTLSTFILFAQRLFNPLQQLAEKFTSIQSGFTAVERIYDLLSQRVDIRDAASPLALPQSNAAQPLGEVAFRQVWFAYKADDYVLKNLTFTIRPGEKVAIVGPTGAGKSSIIRLLCRLYDTTQGSITVDGMDVREVSQTELRRYVGVILQDGFLFAGDVKSNIALGEDYTLAQVQDAAEQMNVASFIEELPEGYNTLLRERGTNLSAGQKQLLAFARAAIRNPRILVLDEATANLDVGTEALIQEALERLLVNRTAIIIAHRLSTIRNADRILVLRQGELVEFGSHEELLDRDGVYANLYRLQMLGQAL